MFPATFDNLDDPREEMTFIVRAKEAVFAVILSQSERLIFPSDKAWN